MAGLFFLDAPAWRAEEIRRLLPGLAFEIGGLPAGYATSAPDPAQRARDKVAASDLAGAVFAEAQDMLTLDGKSLRLDLDSENETRFCRWWRDTEVQLVLCVGLRRHHGGDTQVFKAVCLGRIVERPAGATGHGWDRMLIPAGHTETLAQLSGKRVDFGHYDAFVQMAAALAG